MWLNLLFIPILLTFTEEIFKEKLTFLCKWVNLDIFNSLNKTLDV